MASKNAGEARISIVPDSSGFLKKLEADLKAKRYEYKLPVDADTSQAERETERFRQEQKRKPFGVDVKADVEQARAEIAAFREREQRKALRLKIEFDESTLSDRLRRALDNVDFSGVGSKFGSALLTNGILAGIGELPAAGTAIASVTGALEQLLGAGVAVPGVIGGVVASVGTVKLGLLGVEDAYKALDKASDGSAKSIKAANDALAKLAPSAADAVRTAHDLAGQLSTELGKPIQQNLFSGISGDLKNLSGSLLPILKVGLGGISTALNGDIRQLFTSLGSDSSKGLLDRILGNTGDAETRFQKAIDPLIKGVGTLTAAGSDVLPRLADDIGKGLERFSNFISTADQNGTLSKFINDGITGVEQLGDSFVNVGKIINDITQAAGGGQGLIASLDSATQHLDEFLKSPAGQEQLKQYFAEGKRIIQDDIIPLLQSLPGFFRGVADAGREIADAVVPPLKDVATFLGQHPQLIEAVVVAFGAWKTITAVAELTTSLQTVAAALGLIGPAAAAAGTEGAAGLASLSAALGPIVAMLAAIKVSTPYLENFADANLPHPANAPHGYVGLDVLGLLDGNGPNPNKAPGAGTLQGGIPQAQLQAPANSRDSGGVPNASGLPDAQAKRPAGTRESGGYASGGILPGYSPGRDNMLVPLAGGEGIVRPEAVRKYGPGVIHMLNQGFAPGGIVPDYISIATGGSGGAAPGPIAPNPAQGGIGSIAQSFLSGLGGPIGNLGGLFGGANGSSDSGTTLTPGLAGLFQAGSNPDLLGQWGQQTGDWLGGFAAKTLTSFGTALWQGVLGFFGLGNSILSPTNPYIQDALKGAGFLLGDSGPFAGKGGSSKKGATEKQLREGGQKIDRADQKVALIQQRIAELKPDAKQSQRDSLANQLANAQQDAADARSDFAALQSGSGSSSTGQVPLGTTPPGTGASRWTPVIQQALADVGPKYGITNIPAWTKALEGQIQFESGGDPTIDNPRDSDGQPALGLGQFKQGTFNAHNITGGDVHDGTAAIYAMIDYVASRYGQNSAGVPNGINQGHGYATGGGVDTVPAMLTPGEHVLTTDDVAAMGGQAGVYRFRQALHGYDIGGQVYGGNFNPGVRIDTSTSSVAPPFDPNSLQFGDLLKITGALGPDDIGEQAIHKDHWVPGRDPWLSYGQGINNRPAVPDGKGFSDPNVNPWIAHMAIGGEVYPFPDALTPLPPRPSPDAQKVNRPNPTPAPVVPRPPVVQRPPVVVAPPPVEPPPPAQPEQRPYQPGPAPVGASDGSVKSHTLPAISKGITSGFATAGSLAQTAAAIGSFGAAGAAGGIGAGIGGGGGGPSISGLFQQFGKIANDIVDVGSAFLVGNVTGGTTANAYGETLRPAQNVPLTAPLNQQRTYNIQAGYKPYDLVDALNLMDSQHNQAALAGYRG